MYLLINKIKNNTYYYLLFIIYQLNDVLCVCCCFVAFVVICWCLIFIIVTFSYLSIIILLFCHSSMLNLITKTPVDYGHIGTYLLYLHHPFQNTIIIFNPKQTTAVERNDRMFFWTWFLSKSYIIVLMKSLHIP